MDFFATWCPPCVAIAPVLEKISAEYAESVIFVKVNSRKLFSKIFEKISQIFFYKLSKTLFFKVDVDECEEISAKQGIRAMPTFQFFRQGEKLDEFSGASEARIRETITKHLS